MQILVTGAAGFIGSFTCQRLLDRNDQVIGVDNMNDYYDVGLKEARLERLRKHPGFVFEQVNICDSAALTEVFRKHKPDRVVHLAAQAGVRYSLEHPQVYLDSNITAPQDEYCRDRLRSFRHSYQSGFPGELANDNYS